MSELADPSDGFRRGSNKLVGLSPRVNKRVAQIYIVSSPLSITFLIPFFFIHLYIFLILSTFKNKNKNILTFNIIFKMHPHILPLKKIILIVNIRSKSSMDI